jgi:putative membrane protein
VAGLAVLISGAACIAWMIGRLGRVVGLLVLTGVTEAVGVLTGFPFGVYRYTSAWWPTIRLGPDQLYPLGVPFAWLLVVGGLWLTIGNLMGWRRVLGIGLAAALIDVALEDLMVHTLGYWQWKTPGPVFGAPLQNSVAWLVTATAAAALLCPAKSVAPNQTGTRVLAAYCVLMTVIAGLELRPSLALWLVLTGLLVWRGLGNARGQAV